jgi:leader peptidase (prepilin peptidase)/N-methyltransferase
MISSFATLFLIPVAFLMAYIQLLPISLLESFLGALSGYGFLYGIERLYYLCTNRIGLGYGDIELITCIGAFTGFLGWWSALLLGSLGGSFYGLGMIALTNRYNNRPSLQQALPFGPFLAFGAMIFVCFSRWILQYMLYGYLH